MSKKKKVAKKKTVKSVKKAKKTVKKVAKVIATKKTVKKAAKKAVATKKPKFDVDSEFNNWWSKSGDRKLEKIVEDWKKENPPNDSEEQGGDYWFINDYMWNGAFFELIPESAFKVFEKGALGEKWEMDQTETTYNEDLDSIIFAAYEAGKLLSKKK